MSDLALGTDTLPFRVLLDQAMVWTRRHLRSIVLPLAVPLALLHAGLGAVQAGFLQVTLDPESAASAAAGGLGCGMVALTLLVVLASYLVYSAACAAAVDAVAGRAVAPWTSLRFVLTPAVFGTLVLAGLVLGASYLCCVVPVFVVAPLLSLTVPAMVEEDRRGVSALGRSSELIRYNPQRRFLANPLTKAFVLLLVTFLISMLVTLITSAPFQIAQQWLMLRDMGLADEASMPPTWALWLQVPGAALGSFVSTGVGLYAGFGVALLFFDLRKRKEGLDLEAAIAELDRERAGAPGEPGR